MLDKLYILCQEHQDAQWIMRFFRLYPKDVVIITRQFQMEGLPDGLRMISEKRSELEDFALSRGFLVHRFNDDPIRSKRMADGHRRLK